MKHGDITHPGDEFNKDDMAYCAKCNSIHTRVYIACDGLRTAWPMAPHFPEAGTSTPLRVRPFDGTDLTALAHQEGGGHYKGMKIQPVEFIHANGIPFIEGCVIKYVSRWRAKGGVEDLKKARHFIDLLLDLESRAGASCTKT